MALARPIDHFFDAPSIPFAPANNNLPHLQSRAMDVLLEREFSEEGRNPHFLPGWYILPAAVGGFLVLLALLIR